MIYPEVTLEEWTQRYDLSVEEKVCASCGKKIKTTVPVLIKGYAGLETHEHGCNRKYNAAIFTPITSEAQNTWSKIV